MALVLTHPDYAHDPHLASAWQSLLEEFRDDDTAWRALPREVAGWWRRRAASVIRPSGDTWCVEGPAAGDGSVRFTTPEDRSVLLGTVRAPSNRESWSFCGRTRPV